ncbi:hypothetical protein GCM10010123_45320 [Pilimelia anulata]|uniref:Uncharacterized protein n=1 Tax=Pilimelia anulata TaxID=53371 RepID=A0A8J3FGL7_9ACTN|nr:hypothetical protein GCM10010123_45320 [Pilimelia anulata]
MVGTRLSRSGRSGGVAGGVAGVAAEAVDEGVGLPAAGEPHDVRVPLVPLVPGDEAVDAVAGRAPVPEDVADEEPREVVVHAVTVPAAGAAAGARRARAGTCATAGRARRP